MGNIVFCYLAVFELINSVNYIMLFGEIRCLLFSVNINYEKGKLIDLSMFKKKRKKLGRKIGEDLMFIFL